VATLNKVDTDFQRQQDLLDKGFTKRSTYDDAQEALTSARAALEGAKAALGIARDRLEQTTLRAVAPGIVTARTAEVGQVLAAAQAIFTVARDGDRDAVFDVYEGLMSRKPTDGAVEIELLSDPMISAVGRTREISPVVDAATNTVRIKVGIANTPPKMTLGAPVSGIGLGRVKTVSLSTRIGADDDFGT
jgi:RND family efflux transporter MFP subunit